MPHNDLPCDVEPALTDIQYFTKKLNEAVIKPDVDYAFDEDEYLIELHKYITSTYGQHYAQNKIQSTEFIMDAGHGEGFCIGNVIKYAQRYGKKAGKNRADLLKVCHYAIMMLYVHDHYNNPTEKE